MARRRQRKLKSNQALAWVILTVTLAAAGGGIWYLQRNPLAVNADHDQSNRSRSTAVSKQGPAPAVPDKAASNQAYTAASNQLDISPVFGVPGQPPGGPAPMAPPISIPGPMPTPRPVNDLLEAQIALARVGISAGSIDGVLGSQTRAALRVFQAKERIPVTGKLDLATRERLKITDPILTTYTVRESDVSRLGPVPQTWLGKSQLDRLGYETLLELVAEKSCAHPELIQKLNPGILFPSLTAGAVVNVLNLTTDPPVGKSAFVEIYLAEKCLEVFDAQTNLLAHFPCSIAQRAEKRPIGQLTIKSVVPQPHYVFDPAIFPESAEGQALGRKLVLPPGPNCPVGTVWIGLDRPGYGIHGTPRPEDVGRTESHGCFRLSNWNAEQLMQMVEVGTPVNVKPSHTANWQSGPRSQP